MEQSLFWDAQKAADGALDRTYNSDDFAAMFSGFWGNGIIPNNDKALMVEPLENSMSVYVCAGDAFIGGRFYQLDSDLKFTLDTSGSKSRVDLIALRFDKSKRQIKLRVLKGADDGTTPSYARLDSLYDLILAKVTVKANAQYLTDEDVQDMRGTSLAPWINLRFNLDAIKNSYQAWYDSIQEKLNNIDVAQLQFELDKTKKDLETSNKDLAAMRQELEELKSKPNNSRNIVNKDGRIYISPVIYDANLDKDIP